MDKTLKADGPYDGRSGAPQTSLPAQKPKKRASQSQAGRLSVEKTYKLYINGKFPRTESGRYFKVMNAKGNVIANMCRASRKDFRESVVAARAAFGPWSRASAYLRGQVLYRVAEMLEGRADQFASELKTLGLTKRAAEKDVTAAIDCLVYYAGWADKYQQVFSSVNPVASSHFNFSLLEPVGVVGALSASETSLFTLVADIAPIIAGGNSAIVQASEDNALCAVSFAEVLHSSDVPAGAVNILSGYRDELAEHFASHMDVNAIVITGGDHKTVTAIEQQAANNIKRVIVRKKLNDPSPYQIIDTQEVKTTWHPIGG